MVHEQSARPKEFRGDQAFGMVFYRNKKHHVHIEDQRPNG